VGERTMLALGKAKRGEGLTLERKPIPEPRRGEVLIRVQTTGICGTDVHIYNWDKWAQGRIKPPLTTGHEFVGVIEKAGEGVHHVKPGDRVSAEGHITCGHCHFCRTGQGHICKDVEIIGVDRDGCFAEFLRMPVENLWPVAPGIPNRYAAVFDPLGNAMHTVMAESLSGKSVLITGAGAIGLFAIPIAKVMGASTVMVVEPNPYRQQLARAVKADLVLDPTKDDVEKIILGETHNLGVEVLLEMSGHPQAFRQGFKLLRGAGTAVLLGIPSDELAINWAEDVIFKAATIRGINGRRMFDTWFQSQDFLNRNYKKLDPILTHTFPITEYETAFQLLRDGEAGKIILEIN